MAIRNESKTLYEAACAWRDECLIGDGSLFGSERLWTLERFSELKRLYVDRPDESKRSFIDKLKDQLADGSPETVRLAAELFWPMLLFTASQKPATKIIKMRLVWQWSGAAFPDDLDILEPSLLTGVGSTGPAFQNQFWREYAYAIRLFLAIKAKPVAERRALLSDGWTLAAFLDESDESGARQFYHMLTFLLFPDLFEHIASRNHKSAILTTFGDAASTTAARDRVAVDKALHAIRTRLGAAHGEGFDYYATKIIRDAWYPVSQADADPESEPLAASKPSMPERYRDARFWAVGAGTKGSLWDSFKSSGFIGIGFDDYGQDASSSTRDEILERLSITRGGDHKPTNGALALYQFASEMRVGDYVFAKQGRSTILGFGRVTSGYRYEQGARGFSHRRDITWIKTGPWHLSPDRRITTKTLTEFTAYPDWLFYALTLIGELPAAGGATIAAESPAQAYASVPETTAYGLDELFAEGVFRERLKLEKDLEAWEGTRNLILSGPPGTGKSWLASRLAWVMLGSKDNSRLKRIQFHQSYAYEDFVRGWKPGGGSFVLRDGPFLEFCALAREDPNRPYVLLIDEINRGDMSRVFGELFSLLEKDKRSPEYAMRLGCPRDGEEPFFVPPNLYLIGTMNTADRSLAVVDYALRRRFSFVTLEPAFELDSFSDYLDSERVGASSELIAKIVESMTALNEEIEKDRNLGRGYEIGHSYFTLAPDDDVDVDEAWYQSIIDTRIMPTLEEYWFDRAEKVSEWRKKLSV